MITAHATYEEGVSEEVKKELKVRYIEQYTDGVYSDAEREDRETYEKDALEYVKREYKNELASQIEESGRPPRGTR